jgi:hypothetical protein
MHWQFLTGNHLRIPAVTRETVSGISDWLAPQIAVIGANPRAFNVWRWVPRARETVASAIALHMTASRSASGIPSQPMSAPRNRP